MNISEAIRTKHAVRQFQDKPIPNDIAHAILEAGRRAPSSRNTQPWTFIGIRDRDLLTKLAAMNPNAGHLAGAGLGVVILTPDPGELYSLMFDAGQAATYMQLAAWELGVGSCLGSIHKRDEARDLLGFPADLHVRMSISFGYPLEQPHPAKKGGRKPFEEVVHWDKYRS